ncbi:DUF294 nucleotidyltransferase-like domain-containing protein [Pelagibaculum spongiae]|nr:DUF294 nucleotidyltransferase-like domain-containing protein [Pelagibaculum spongiae]
MQLVEISRFLKSYPPFDGLSEEALERLASSAEISYVRSGADILQYGDPIQDLYVIRSGSVEVFRRNGDLHNRLDAGDIFGQMGLMMNGRVRFPVRAMEDTLLYCFPRSIYHEYCDNYDVFSDFFESEGSTLLRQTLSNQSDSNDLTTVKIKSLITRDAVTISAEADIVTLSKLMTDERVSYVLIVDEQPDDAEIWEQDSQIIGIVTDHDLRSKVLAHQLPYNTKVGEVMTTDLTVLDENAYVYEATLKMLREGVHHLPVVRTNNTLAVISLTDIVQHESQSSLLFVRSIATQANIEELAKLSEQLPNIFVRMVNEDANSHMIGSAMAVIGRAIKQRLLELAEEQLGAPPIPYCFMALGAMARDEQLIVTDQDNAIILDNSYQEELHGEYFDQLSQLVCDGLDKCGYCYCTGDIMASNPEWRLTLQQWRDLFTDWIEKPSPKALLHSSIFFDLDGVWGQEKWARHLSLFIARKTRNSPRFLSHLARNALNRTPPLGFFKGFVMEQDGQHKKSINLKRRGTAPLTDVIRVHALAVGSTIQNSFERLDDVAKANVLPSGKAQDLSDALEYISMVRIRHQAADIERGDTPDNNIEPDNLSTFERKNLKEAFQVLDRSQSYLKFCYPSKKNNL